MRIGGIIDISTKDIPDRVSMVIFTVGCNFKCGFCHNKYLLYPEVGKSYLINYLLKTIKSNVLVNSVSITGGEPTLQEDLPESCKEISKLGKYLSIDTNGSNPSMIKEIIPYINRIALDLKGPLEKERLRQITRVNVNPNLIIETFNIVNQHKEIEFEVRTTYVENLHNPNDFEKIVSFLKDNEFRGNFVLQQYQYSEGVGKKYHNKFQKTQHITLINLLKPHINEVLPFKIYLRNDIVGYSEIEEVFKNLG